MSFADFLCPAYTFRLLRIQKRPKTWGLLLTLGRSMGGTSRLASLTLTSIFSLPWSVPLAYSYPSRERTRLDFTVETSHPTFLPRRCLLAAGEQKNLWTSSNPLTWVPRVARLHEVTAAAQYWMGQGCPSESVRGFPPKSRNWKPQGEFLFCFWKIYLSVTPHC